MICVRCQNSFKTDRAVRNAEVYGSNYLACPHCGKPYYLQRIVQVQAEPTDLRGREEDDWGHKIVNDGEYYKKLQMKKVIGT